MENQHVVILTLLDMSSAFDTVDHDLLLLRLSAAGIKGDALKWYRHYLTNRTQLVLVNNGIKSSSRKLTCGVPQGSVLGPLLFSLYISGIRHVFQRHNIEYHCYADDLQLFIAAKPAEIPAVSEKLNGCLAEVSNWLQMSHLSLNGNKSEVIVFGSKTTLSKCPPISIQIGESSVTPSVSGVRDLGVHLDSLLSMNTQVNKVSSLAFNSLRLISRIRRSLDIRTCKLLVDSLVFSHIDYCGSLLFGINSTLVKKLQRIIHSAIRLVECLARTDHVTFHCRQHRWLPAQGRIAKRAHILVFKAIKGMAPPYLQTLIPTYTRMLVVASKHKDAEQNLVSVLSAIIPKFYGTVCLKQLELHRI
jgi:hypothetical protein